MRVRIDVQPGVRAHGPMELEIEGQVLPVSPNARQVHSVQVSGSDVEGHLRMNGESHGFGLRDLPRDAELRVRVESPKRFTVDVVHAVDASRRCRVRCPDGTEDYPCVECSSGSVTYRVCC